MTLVPWAWICSSMAARAPEERAIIAITEATPMMTPRAVRAERTALRRRAIRAMRRVLAISISHLHGRRRHGGDLAGGVAPRHHHLVAHHAAVPEAHHPLGV